MMLFRLIDGGLPFSSHSYNFIPYSLLILDDRYLTKGSGLGGLPVASSIRSAGSRMLPLW